MIAGFTFDPVDTSNMNIAQKSEYYLGLGLGEAASLMTGEAGAIGFVNVAQDLSIANLIGKFKNNYFSKAITDELLVEKTRAECININASSPSQIAWGYGELSNRQASILNQLPGERSMIQLHKSDINVTDLAALTAKTGDEFAMFTLGSRRIIVRGSPSGVVMVKDLQMKLKRESWTWSAHTHPGIKDIVLNASGFPGDREGLSFLSQSRSLILNSAGKKSIFDLENDIRITSKSQYEHINDSNKLNR